MYKGKKKVYKEYVKTPFATFLRKFLRHVEHKKMLRGDDFVDEEVVIPNKIQKLIDEDIDVR